MATFKRTILPPETTNKVASELQPRLVDLIDLALQLKQAHWTVTGSGFQHVHEQLDSILESVREASDEVAERIATLGIAPDGRATTVASDSRLPPLEAGFLNYGAIVTAVADLLHATITGIRESIEPLGDLDPISEDMLIGISAGLEQHLWMIQAQEL